MERFHWGNNFCQTLLWIWSDHW